MQHSSDTATPDAIRFLMAKEVAEETRVPEATLAWWRHVGQGPAWFKIGRRVLYRRDELDKWLTEQMNAAPYSRGAR